MIYDSEKAAQAALKKKVWWLLSHIWSLPNHRMIKTQPDGVAQRLERINRLTKLIEEEVVRSGLIDDLDDPDCLSLRVCEWLQKPFECSDDDYFLNNCEQLAFEQLRKEAGDKLEESADSTKELYWIDGGPFIHVADVVERTKQMQAKGGVW